MSTHSHSHGSTATLLPQHTQDVSVSFDNYSGSEVKPSISLSGTVKKWARYVGSSNTNGLSCVLHNLRTMYVYNFVNSLPNTSNKVDVGSDIFHQICWIPYTYPPQSHSLRAGHQKSLLLSLNQSLVCVCGAAVWNVDQQPRPHLWLIPHVLWLHSSTSRTGCYRGGQLGAQWEVLLRVSPRGIYQINI